MTGMELADRSRKQKKAEEEKEETSLYHRRLALRMILRPGEDMKFLLHRLIVVGKISPQLADKRDLGAHYEKLSQHLQLCHQADSFTGLLLLYPSHVVHILESSSQVLVAVLQDLCDIQKRPDCTLVLESRIVVVSHDIQGRLFQDWSYKLLDLPATMLSDRSKHEPVEKLVSGTLKTILKLGSYLTRRGKGSSVSAASLQKQVPELIVPQDILAQLIEQKELLTPQQYLQRYHSPLDIPINSGHTFGSRCLNVV